MAEWWKALSLTLLVLVRFQDSTPQSMVFSGPATYAQYFTSMHICLCILDVVSSYPWIPSFPYSV